MKKKFFVCLLILLSSSAFPENMAYVDSIKTILQTGHTTAKDNLELYEKLAGYYCTNDADETLKYSFIGLELALEESDYQKEASFYRFIGAAYDVKGDFDSAMSYYDKSYELAIRLKDKEMEGQAYRMHTFTYFRQGKYLLALQSCMRVLKHFEDLDDISGKMGSLGCIGEIYQILGNTERALYYTKQSLDMAEEYGAIFFMMQLYNIMGSIYIDMDDYDEALKYKEMALRTSREGNNLLNECTSLQGLAKIYLKLGNQDRAFEYVNQSLSIVGKVSDPTILVGSLAILSNIYREQKRYKECELTAFKAWEIDSTYADLAPNLAYNIALSNIYLKNQEKAIYFLLKSEELNKGKVGKNIHEALLDMEVKNESEKNHMRITSLEKEKDLNKKLNIAWLTILLLLTGLFLFSLRFITQKRKIAEQQIKHLEQEKQLVAAQALLEGETTERKRLARDLHDGLGGILSLTKLRLKELESICVENGSDSTRFSQTLSALDMAIIELRRVAHHMMPESLMHLGLKTSIDDFCRAIPGVSFHYLGSDMRLDAHLEVLIYRCAYELVNNALKHSGATSINVQLIVEEKIISLTVQDNGCGFDPQNIVLGAGLENIKTRVSAYNGIMNLYSSSGNGTEVSIEIEWGDIKE